MKENFNSKMDKSICTGIVVGKKQEVGNAVSRAIAEDDVVSAMGQLSKYYIEEVIIPRSKSLPEPLREIYFATEIKKFISSFPPELTRSLKDLIERM